MSFNLTRGTKTFFSKWKGEVEEIMRNQRMFPKIKRVRTIDDLLDYQNPSNEQDVYVIDGKKQDDPVFPLTKGYYRAVCLGIIELPDGESFILIFDPYDEDGWRHTEICLTVTKEIRSSEALGGLLFAFGKHEGMHSDSSMVIDNVAAFREMFEDTEVGIEVSENSATGLLYVTDFFNLVDTDKFPTCPEEIVRNVF